MASRASAKAGNAYRNESWDLVDAQKEGVVDVTTMSKADLPAALRDVPAAERLKVVAEQQAKRNDLQQRIAQLSKDRDTFVATEEAKLAATGTEPTLREALRSSLREQAAKLGYETTAPVVR